MMLDGLDADRGGEMRSLARAGAADQDDVVRVLQELAAVELAHQRLVDLTAGEVEAGKVAIVRKAGGFELIGRRPYLPVGCFAFKSCDRMGSAASKGRRALLGQFAGPPEPCRASSGFCNMMTTAPAAGL